MPGFALSTAPRELRAFIAGLCDDIVGRFPETVAVILEGSLAMGAFYPPKSDIDLLVVVRELSEVGRAAFFDLLRKHHARRPYVGGLEAAVIDAVAARAPVHPMPVLVQFSETAEPPEPRSDGQRPRDDELISHLYVARQCGLSLYGPEPQAVIGPIAWEDHLAAVRADIEWILDGENLLATPFYGVLNLCRWAMIQASPVGAVMSKDAGGEWALTHLAAPLRPIVTEALDAYRSSAPVRSAEDRRVAGRSWDRDQLLAFRDAMRPYLT